MTCRHCNDPVVSGHLHCEQHLEYFRTASWRRRRKRISAGLCVNVECGGLLFRSGLCAEHYAANQARCVSYMKARVAARRAAGVCITCGEDSNGAARCETHAELERQYARARRKGASTVRP